MSIRKMNRTNKSRQKRVDTEAVYDYTNKADALKRLARMVRGNKRVTPDNDHKYYNKALLAVTVWNNEADEVVKEVVIYEG
jgi:hypothetical protein